MTVYTNLLQLLVKVHGMNGDSDVRITTLHEQLLKCGKELLCLILESLIRHLRQSHGQKNSGGVLEWKNHINITRWFGKSDGLTTGRGLTAGGSEGGRE